MPSILRSMRVMVFVLACLLPTGLSQTAAYGQSIGTKPQCATFFGLVLNLSGPATNPTGFVLQTKLRIIPFRLTTHTSLTGNSAEAAVEGFQANDYAYVCAVRVDRIWKAQSIKYDVQPFNPKQAPSTITLRGTILRVTPNGLRFTMLLESGATRVVNIGPKTKYLIDGQTMAGLPIVGPGDIVAVTMRRDNRGAWLALQINEVTASQ